EVGDHAVLHRSNRDHAFGRSAEHSLGFEADALDLLGFAVDRHHGWLIQDDALTLDVDQGVRSAEVDTDCVRGEKTSRLEEGPAHQSGVGAPAPLQGTSRTIFVGENYETYRARKSPARHCPDTTYVTSRTRAPSRRRK